MILASVQLQEQHQQKTANEPQLELLLGKVHQFLELHGEKPQTACSQEVRSKQCHSKSSSKKCLIGAKQELCAKAAVLNLQELQLHSNEPSECKRLGQKVPTPFQNSHFGTRLAFFSFSNRQKHKNSNQLARRTDKALHQPCQQSSHAVRFASRKQQNKQVCKEGTVHMTFRKRQKLTCAMTEIETLLLLVPPVLFFFHQ